MKETGGIEGQELFTSEILDLAFLDNVKQKHLHRGGSSDQATHDKFMRRKIMKKVRGGTGDMAEVDSDDSYDDP